MRSAVYGGQACVIGLKKEATWHPERREIWEQAEQGSKLPSQQTALYAGYTKWEPGYASWSFEDRDSSACSSSSTFHSFGVMGIGPQGRTFRRESIRQPCRMCGHERCLAWKENRTSTFLLPNRCKSSSAAGSSGVLGIVDTDAKGSFLEPLPDSPAVLNRYAPTVAVGFTDNEAAVRALCKEGKLDEAVGFLSTMDEKRIEIQPRMFSSILKLCIRMKAIEKGKRVHGYVIKSGLETDLVLANILVNMYAKSGSIVTARQLFDNMPKRDVISWTALISGCVVHGYIKDAFMLFKQMQDSGIKPTRVTFISMLNACASLGSLEEGKRMHALVVQSELEFADYIANSLVNMYAKCGSMEEARKVFRRMRERDTISWNAMITGYANSGRGWEALDFFKRMRREGMSPDAYTFVSVLTACASLGALKEGMRIHDVCRQTGWHTKTIVANSLIEMYAKCRSIDDARQVFDSMRKHDLVSWNSMINGYSKNGLHKQAYTIFEQMAAESVLPDGVTFVSILNACGTAAALDQGRAVHAYLHKIGFEADAFVWNALIDMYAKCGSMEDACDVFEKMERRDVVSWNTLIAGYTQNSQPEESVRIFHRMHQEDVNPSAITFSCIFKACTNLVDLDNGKEIHALMDKSGIEAEGAVKSALLDMYVGCGSLDDACKVLYNLPEGCEVPKSCLDSSFWTKRGYNVC